MSAWGSAEWLFEVTLKSYPHEFRVRHGGPMRTMFREQWAERAGRHVLRRIAFLGVALVDSLRQGLALRLRSLFAGRGSADGGGMDLRRRNSGTRETAQAVRALSRRPAFTALAVGTLALGIGGVASIGSVAYHVLLAPLSYADGEEIIRLWWNGRILSPELTRYYAASSSMIEDFAENNRTVRELTWVSARSDATLMLDDGGERVQAGSAAPNFFTFLGVEPELGRLDVAPDANEAGIVVSHAEWLTRWRGDPSIVGRTLRLQNAARPVIGVLPPDFEWIGRTGSIERAEYWIVGRVPPVPGYAFYHPLVKPAEGHTIEEVRQDFARSAWAEISEGAETRLAMSDAATAELVRTHTLDPLRIKINFLFASVLFVALLGALAVSNLFMGRLSDRDREMAVRLSLGASRADLIRLIALEVLLVATAGAVLGTLLAHVGLAGIRAGAPVGIPRLSSAAISPVILAGVIAMTAVVAIIVIVPPALRTVSDAAGTSFTRLAGGGRKRARSRTLLILSQVTIATVLLIGSALMLRSLYTMETVDLGFDPDGVVAGTIRLPTSYWTPSASDRGDQGPQVLSTSEALEEDLVRFRARIAAIPGIEDVSFVDHVPLSGAYGTRIPLVPEDRKPPADLDNSDLISKNLVDTRFFDLLNVSLVEGRTFRSDDLMPGAPPVAVVSDRLAERYWPGESAIGKRFSEQFEDMTGDGGVRRREFTVEIVGIVAGLREKRLENVEQSVYYPKKPHAQPVARPNRNLSFLAATALEDPTLVMPALRRVVADVFPGEPLRHFAPLSATVDEHMTESVFYTTLLSLFAAYALLLSLVGIMGVVHHQISRRQNEVAIRIVLGALPGEALRLLGRQTALTTASGIAIGLIIAAGLARLIESMLFEVVPLDPWTFAAIPLLFLGAAVAAAVVPGRRLTELRPAEALRSE